MKPHQLGQVGVLGRDHTPGGRDSSVSQQNSSIKVRQSGWRAPGTPPPEVRRMHTALTLFSTLPFLSLIGTHPALRTEMIRTLAKTTEARIKRIRAEHFQMSAEISFGNSQEIPIEGLNSILTHLGALQAKLRFPPTHRLRQVEEDVDSLLGYLREMALVQGCAPPKLGRDPHKADAPFPITANYLSLLDLQMFLEKLCLNLDKLKPC